MKFTRFEKSVIAGLFLAWIQLMCGLHHHAFFTIGTFIIICLIAIIEYLRIK